MHVFPKTAGLGAVNPTLVWQKGAAQKRALTLGTAEAAFSGMPVEPIIGHLSMINAWKTDNIEVVRIAT